MQLFLHLLAWEHPAYEYIIYVNVRFWKWTPFLINRLPPKHCFSASVHWPYIWTFVSQCTSHLSPLSTTRLSPSLESFSSVIAALFRSRSIFNFFLLKDATENSLIFLLCWNQNSYESEANSELHSTSAIFGWYVLHWFGLENPS